LGIINISLSENKDSVKFVIVGKNSTWVGIGFGSKMANTDMHVVNFLTNKKYEASDRYSFGYEEPKFDTKLNGTDDLKNITIFINPQGNPVLTYYRKFNTSDKNDYVLGRYSHVPLILAWGNGTIDYHGSNQFATNIFIGDTPATLNYVWDFWDYHGTFLSISWMALNTPGFILVRYFKTIKFGILGHVIFSGLSSFITIIIGIISLIKGIIV
jgi:hypothetical protein